MSLHPEERRIAGLLRELIVQSGVPLDTLEERLGWEAGRLSGLLDGQSRLGFEDLLEILPLLETTPTDFFAWLYGFGNKDRAMTEGEMDVELETVTGGSAAQRPLDRRFDQSLQVVKSALSRRRHWKEERRK